MNSDQEPNLKDLKKLDQIQIQSPSRHPVPHQQRKQKQSNIKQSSHNHHHQHHNKSQSNEIALSLGSKKQIQHSSHAASYTSASSTNPAPLYEQTYYLTGLRENYLVLISDNMHIIQLPVGLLKANVTIGDPIKLKLQFDGKRAQSDRRKFITTQENIIKDLSQD